ncbi:MAG: hypothetical protein A2010_11525 [Nitrospirae bacterium GWD2_57_9]|nr:MAG: hypothetical protein A2010_11525 [Nitrospirae bacterium GWD2_57_9]OGW49064.1 MAG: hypothetical protein A2078_09440 [Nitrospirae bacterium GWC2_57_9]
MAGTGEKASWRLNFCDLDCIYARFPKSDAVDGSRSCRTFVALQCRLKKSWCIRTCPVPRKRRGKGSRPPAIISEKSRFFRYNKNSGQIMIPKKEVRS